MSLQGHNLPIANRLSPTADGYLLIANWQRARQLEPHHRTTITGVCCTNRPTMLLCNLTDDGETEAGARQCPG
jgi:hypothetical protein